MSKEAIRKRNKKINLSAWLMVVICFVLCFSPTIASAKADNEKQLEKADVILNGSFDTINDILTGDVYSNMVASDFGASSTVHTVYGPSGPTSGYAGEFAILYNVYTGLKIVGALWVIIIAMAHLFNNIERGQDPAEAVFKILTEIGITLLFLMNLDKVSTIISQLGQVIIDMAGGLSVDPAAGASSFTAEDLIKAVSEDGKASGGWGWRVKVDFHLFLPYALSFIIRIVAGFAVYQQVFEIGIRRVFMPMAVADIYQEGLRSPGARYIKKYFGAFLKLAITVLICKMLGAVVALAAADPAALGAQSFMVQILILNFSAVGFIFKAGEFSNDIIGA